MIASRVRLFLFTIVLLAIPLETLMAGEHELVVITSTKNNFAPIARDDLRRLFLGIKPKHTDIKITPINNKSENILYEVFLQKVIRMSAVAYERHLLSKVFTHGTQRIKTTEEYANLLKELEYNENAISFVWANDLKKNPEIRVVQSIWKGQISQ